MVGVSRNTVTKLLGDLAQVCSDYQHVALRNLPCKHVQADEIWSFVAKKAKNVRGDEEQWVGDVWTFTAVCADTKLVPTWLVGARDGFNAEVFVRDLESRLAERVQLSTDGHSMYLDAVEKAFGRDGVDYAVIMKKYGADPEPQKRYSPAKCIGVETAPVYGEPDPAHVSTSFVERQNLTMRMSMRRFTRLTNAFSKKVENHAAAVAIHFMFYNFARPHQSLRTKKNNRITPAMAAGVADHCWTVEEIVALLPEVVHSGGRPRKAENS
jgi:IS1 family transposase